MAPVLAALYHAHHTLPHAALDPAAAGMGAALVAAMVALPALSALSRPRAHWMPRRSALFCF